MPTSVITAGPDLTHDRHYDCHCCWAAAAASSGWGTQPVGCCQVTRELVFSCCAVRRGEPVPKQIPGPPGLRSMSDAQSGPRGAYRSADRQPRTGLQAALRWTIDYVRGRNACGKPIRAPQNTRFALADVATRGVGDRDIRRPLRGRAERGPADPGRRRQKQVAGDRDGVPLLDSRQQLFGGYTCPNIRSPGRPSMPASPACTAALRDHARDHRPRSAAGVQPGRR